MQKTLGVEITNFMIVNVLMGSHGNCFPYVSLKKEKEHTRPKEVISSCSNPGFTVNQFFKRHVLYGECYACC